MEGGSCNRCREFVSRMRRQSSGVLFIRAVTERHPGRHRRNVYNRRNDYNNRTNPAIQLHNPNDADPAQSCPWGAWSDRHNR